MLYALYLAEHLLMPLPAFDTKDLSLDLDWFELKGNLKEVVRLLNPNETLGN